MLHARQANPHKPDMQAYKKLKGEARKSYGHVPGVAVGEAFNNRGELAILGLHRRILQGIDGDADGGGAYGICLSGGYKVGLTCCCPGTVLRQPTPISRHDHAG